MFQLLKQGGVKMSKVRELREGAGLKQDELATLLDISSANYCKKESGIIRFSLPEAKILADYFHTTIEAIFFTTEVSKTDTLS